MTEIHGSPEWEKTMEISMMAITVPMTGVHKPRRRNIPVRTPIRCRRLRAD
jgi:hypothetical protein